MSSLTIYPIPIPSPSGGRITFKGSITTKNSNTYTMYVDTDTGDPVNFTQFSFGGGPNDGNNQGFVSGFGTNSKGTLTFYGYELVNETPQPISDTCKLASLTDNTNTLWILNVPIPSPISSGTSVYLGALNGSYTLNGTVTPFGPIVVSIETNILFEGNSEPNDLAFSGGPPQANIASGVGVWVKIHSQPNSYFFSGYFTDGTNIGQLTGGGTTNNVYNVLCI